MDRVVVIPEFVDRILDVCPETRVYHHLSLLIHSKLFYLRLATFLY